MTDLSSGARPVLALTRDRIDSDPQETAEWLTALDGVVQHVGLERAQYLFDRLAAHALGNGVATARASSALVMRAFC